MQIATTNRDIQNAEPLAHYLMDKPVTIVQVNPLHTKRLKEVNDNSPLKTDDKDPRVIADVLRLGHALSVVIPEGDAAYLRRLNNARERHVGERTALLNQLQQLVFLIFPELKAVFNDVTVKTARHILKRYTTLETVDFPVPLQPQYRVEVLVTSPPPG